MNDDAEQPKGLPPGASHLGTFKIVGSGTFVGGVVKLRNDPEKDLLHTADSFRKAADRCLNSCKAELGIEMLTVPGAVCAAFACELYLKFVHLVEIGSYPPEHRLLELFNGCSDDVKKSLRDFRVDIDDVVKRNNSHFVDARYHHEEEYFSFRQQELLQLAESLSDFVRSRYQNRIA